MAPLNPSAAPFRPASAPISVPAAAADDHGLPEDPWAEEASGRALGGRGSGSVLLRASPLPRRPSDIAYSLVRACWKPQRPPRKLQRVFPRSGFSARLPVFRGGSGIALPRVLC